MKKTLSPWIVIAIGFVITFVGNFFPNGYEFETAGTLLDLFGVAIMVFGLFGFRRKKPGVQEPS